MFKNKEIDDFIHILNNNKYNNIEIEARIGVLENGIINSHVDKNFFNKILESSLLFDDKVNSIETYNISCVDSDSNIRLSRDINQKKNILIKKTTFKNYFSDTYPISLKISKEDTLNMIENIHCKDYFKFRKRITKKSYDNIVNYDFGIIKEFFNPAESSIIEEIRKFKLDPEKYILNNNFSYEIEIEFVGNGSNSNIILNSIHNNIVLTYNQFNNKFNNILIKIYSYLRLKLLKNNRKLISDITILDFINKAVSFQRKNLVLISNYKYDITVKIDGFGICLVVYYDTIYIIRTDNVIIDKFKNKTLANNSLFLGELVDKDIYLYDTLIYDDENISNDILESRLSKIKAGKINKYYKVHIKKYYKSNDMKSFSSALKKICNIDYEYDIDGIIINSSDTSYYEREIFKWKPPNKLSIDFKILIKKTDKKEITLLLYTYIGKSESESIIKTLDNVTNDTIIYGEKQDDLLFIHNYIKEENSYKSILKYKKIKNKIYYKDIELIDGDVYEFIYIGNKWTPIKHRDDKQTGNHYGVALNTWDSIKNYINYDMLIGKEIIPESYWDISSLSKSSMDDVKKAHNKIKYNLYETHFKNTDILIDIAGGHANDISKWKKNMIKTVIIIEKDKNAIKEGIERIANLKKKDNLIPDVIYIEADIITDDVIQKLLKLGIEKESVTNITCNFAIHYFMQSKETLGKIIDIVTYFLMKHGKFMFITFDGIKIFELLKNTGRYDIFINKKLMLLINKKYNNPRFNNFNQEIEVYNDSIGSINSEYLVNFSNINQILTTKKMKLLYDDDFHNMRSKLNIHLNQYEETYSNLYRVNIYIK